MPTGRRILVIEDEVIIAMEIESHLQRAGYDVLGPVATRADALAETAGRPPHLVLADVRIADTFTGIEIGAELLALYRTPFLVLTAHSDPETRKTALEEGARAVISKPFEPTHLLTTIARFINSL